MDYYDKAVELMPNFPECLSNKASLYIQMN